jgi:hypothetical protein
MCESYRQDSIIYEPQLMINPVPDICPDRVKAIEKQIITLEFFDAQTVKGFVLF